MAVELRPLSLGELLDRCFQYYRRHFGLFVGILVIPLALLAAVSVAYQGMVWRIASLRGAVSLRTGLPLAITLLYFVLVLVISVLGYVSAQGAATYALSQVYLDHPSTISSAYRGLKGRYGELIWLSISIGIRIALFFIPCLIGVAIIAVGAHRHSSLALIGVVVVIGGGILGFYLCLPYALAVPALVVENIEPRAAIDRCSDLAEGYRWQLLVIGILMSLLTWVVMVLVEAPLAAAVALGAAHKTGPHPVLAVVTAGISPLAKALTGPLFVIAFTIAYYDRRVRKEGFDLDVMLRNKPPGQPPQNLPPETSPAS
ncbi:MAG: hypothetical protein ACRD11_06145 [Terriglobia bacterium]